MKIPFLSQHASSAELPSGVTRPTWVIIDIAGTLPARQPTSPLAALMNKAESLESLQTKLDKLAKADWLHGVLLRFGTYEGGYATASAIAQMVERFGRSNKRTVSYLPHISMPSLLAASGAQEVVAPESAEVMLNGFGAEVTYLGEFLKKHGIEFENLRIREFKSALTRFSQDHMDEAQRLQTTELLRSLEDAWVHDLSRRRALDSAAVRAVLHEGISSAERLREAGLINRVAYEDELIGPATRPLSAVLDLLLPAPQDRKVAQAGRVALIPVVGNIVTGKSRHNPLPLPLIGGQMVGSDTVIAAFRRAKDDKTTKAIVLYVDSGGGSALASDLIWREIATSPKPVVAVMGSMAASGGYYVLTHAQHVVASPYTITGSIGVVTGKPVLQGFNTRQGFHAEQVKRQENALLHSSATPFSDSQRREIERSLSEVYTRFISRVAQGRKMSLEQVDDLGKGRVWSAPDALSRGLVDELGDLQTGIDRACELAGLSYKAPVWTATPRSAGLLPQLVEEAAALSLMPPFLNDQALLWLDTGLELK